ncbi:hypothetical protein ACERII_25155 [Evansella sp. AB-rgal1]|uniref:hypothetical protein n=1 Tax=Evansella sp. AB-rgal1 TaxID=3242696 RepID=UPI00359D4542
MSDNQMDRFEGMLTQLVSMVGTMKVDLEEVKADVSELKADVSALKEDVSTLKADVSQLKLEVNDLKDEQLDLKETQERQHNEVMDKLHSLEIDQDLTWTKVSANEKEIGRLKKMFNL